MKQKNFAILLVVFATILTTAGQYFLKKGAVQIVSFYSIFNISLISGLIIYGCAAVLLILSLQKAELSVVYPFIALSFIWVTFVSLFLLQETVSVVQWLGVISIVFGVTFIGFGGEHS